MFKKILFIIIIFSLSHLKSQDLSLYKKEIFVHNSDSLNYRILKPLNYNPNKLYPVHLFLHGSGERGNNNTAQLTHGGELFLREENRELYNSWVIFPQAPKHDWWGYEDPYKFAYDVKESKAMNLVVKFMDNFLLRKDVNPKQSICKWIINGWYGNFCYFKS